MNPTEFFIKPGYKENPVITFSTNPSEYWTPNRIETSHEFQYHVYEYASKLVKKRDYTSVIDIGAGPGTKLSHFFSDGEVKLTILDQPGMEPIVQKMCPTAKFIGVNLEDRSFRSGEKYDLLICSDVIEHLQNPNSLLDIFHAHMEKESLAIISTPDRDMRRGPSNLQSPNKAHVREWNFEELANYLKERDFEIVDHFNLPLKKLSPLTFKVSQNLFYKKIYRSNWFACQTVVVKKK